MIGLFLNAVFELNIFPRQTLLVSMWVSKTIERVCLMIPFFVESYSAEHHSITRHEGSNSIEYYRSIKDIHKRFYYKVSTVCELKL